MESAPRLVQETLGIFVAIGSKSGERFSANHQTALSAWEQISISKAKVFFGGNLTAINLEIRWVLFIHKSCLFPLKHNKAFVMTSSTNFESLQNKRQKRIYIGIYNFTSQITQLTTDSRVIVSSDAMGNKFIGLLVAIKGQQMELVLRQTTTFTNFGIKQKIVRTSWQLHLKKAKERNNWGLFQRIFRVVD